jgi:hypothetical protein
VLQAALASGYTHYMQRSVIRGDGKLAAEDGVTVPVRETLDDILGEDCEFEEPSERAELPVTYSVGVAGGPMAGVVLATYEFARFPSVWERLKHPEV